MLKKITSSLSRISPDQYLVIVVLSLVVLSFANLLFCTMMYELGANSTPGYTSPFPGPEDRFADLVKVSFSYRDFASGISTEAFLSWPKLFERYYVAPVYQGKEGLDAGVVITHFHLPPLSTLLFIACAALIGHTQSVLGAIVIFFGVYLLTVQGTLLAGIAAEKRTLGVTLMVWFIALLSYPALFLFGRGNFNAGFTSLLIVVFLLRLFLRNSVGVVALLSLAIAVNFRPNAAIFVLAIPVVLGLKQSIKPVLYFGTLASGIFAACYFAANSLYPDYTIRAFLRGLDIYKKLYILGPGSDAYNSSLWALVKNFGRISAGLGHREMQIGLLLAILLVLLFWGLRHLAHWAIVVPLVLLTLYFQFVAATGDLSYCSPVFAVMSLLLAATAGWGLWRSPNRTLIAPFVLTACYCLICPVFADYHLLVFLGPVLLLYFNHREWADSPRSMVMIALGCVLMLSPKNYVFVDGLSLQTLLNPLSLYFLVLCVSEASSIRQSAHHDVSLETVVQ